MKVWIMVTTQASNAHSANHFTQAHAPNYPPPHSQVSVVMCSSQRKPAHQRPLSALTSVKSGYF